MTNISNLIFATKESFGTTLEPGGTFKITDSFEPGAEGIAVSVELPEETSIVIKNSSQIERMTITATGGVATIVKRGLTTGDSPVEDEELRKPWGDGETCYTTLLAFNVVDSQDDNNFSGDNTHTGTDTFNNIILSGDTTTAGLTVKSLTETQRDALTPAEGMIIKNSTSGVLNQYIGGAWAEFSTGTTPNASLTTAGKIQVPTDTQVGDGDSTGSTGALLGLTVDNTTTTQVTKRVPVLDVNGRVVPFINSEADGQATTTEKGLVELATDAEAEAGTDEEKYVNPKQLSEVAVTSFDANRAAFNLAGIGTTTTITHNLGQIPKVVKLTGFNDAGTGENYSFGTYITSSGEENCISMNNGNVTSSSSYSIIGLDSVSDYQTGTITTIDTTQIVITWTKTGVPEGTVIILAEFTA